MTAEIDSRAVPPTAQDVAAAAGVSRSTVSHILNGRGERFPEATRERVLAAAATLDYRPSPAGRMLVNGRSDTLVVLAPNTTWGPNLQDAVDQVTKDTASLGASVVVRFSGAGDVETTLSSILTMRPFAVVDLGVLSDADRHRLADRGVITVPSTDSMRATVDLDRTIAELQVGALATPDRRPVHFAALSDGRLDLYGPRRLGYLVDSCVARGLPMPGRVAVSLDLDETVSVLRSIAADGPVALACYNDDVAMAVLAAARVLDLRVPQDVAVVGVDHTPIGQLWSPRLTTIDVDIRALMDQAIHDLRSHLGEEPVDRPDLDGLAVLVQGGSS